MKKILAPLFFIMVFAACSPPQQADQSKASVATGIGTIELPAPYATKSTKVYCDVIGWNKAMPIAPAGFKVSLFGDSLTNPRNIYVGRNGDVFVSEANTELGTVKRWGAAILGITKSQYLGKSKNDIILFREVNGKPQNLGVFLSGLNQPYGMLIWRNYFYVACTDGLWAYPYQQGQTRITATGKKLLDLPAGGYNNHWTRNVIVSGDSTHLFVSVGSGSNDGEHGMDNEVRRADILQIKPDGSQQRVYASGLRNPAGISINPFNYQLWASVNERDDLGDELVPDYLTSVKDSAFYGWPYAYFGQHEDPNHKGERPDMVKKTLVPDVSLGAHTASLGLAFYIAKAFPAKYWRGAFVTQHGSWNSSTLVGYKVLFVPFTHGKPGKPEDFLTGFIADAEKHQVHGRPVGVAIAKDGALLIADDTSNKIWKVSVNP
ncbi:glucose/arabinose dehydrogenase [Mucilaginibacter gracilis]|uniref:Glucose/arabinose dehydrogenase n=1 Tax=Mucilaginibacter gracilis TaxID=423350 RepID=A0A495ITW1_9SPHI|nr:sorbosone dehydrogenase family protein [Mucilaginibacter gracilis]RKR80197.1 glucose/arabinose dehydrogenase [Mucilaginibacter gracilis]